MDTRVLADAIRQLAEAQKAQALATIFIEVYKTNELSPLSKAEDAVVRFKHRCL